MRARPFLKKRLSETAVLVINMIRIEEPLLAILNEALKELCPGQDVTGKLILDLPDDSNFGDLSTNIALRLAKPLKSSPRKIGEDLILILNNKLKNSPVARFVREIKTEGAGFINFYLHENYFYEFLGNILKDKESAFKPCLGNGRRVLIEFVSANPTGSLSVAHARQAAVGDSLANILDFSGFQVKREYYLNDEGNQINILGQSVALRLEELNGGKIEFPENYYQGDYIYDIARKIRDELIKQDELGDYAAARILDEIKNELSDFGVNFDYWSSQKELRKSGNIKEALDTLREKGLLYESEGATWFKSTQFGDDKDRVVVKSDGSYTYLAPDIAYHREKYRRGFAWLINLWGPDHHGYINRLKAAVEGLGKPCDSLSIIIVQLATIFRGGEQVHMSTRRGQYITLREVLDEVGRDASRFFFCMRRTSSHLDFDLEIAKKQTSENPVFYVQYAYARICSILRNSTDEKKGPAVDLTLLKEKEEMELIKKIWQLPFIVNICVKTLDPFMLTVYVQGLAESFHKFYDVHRVLGQEESLSRARLSLLESSRIAIATCLDLLGVSKPEKM